MFIYGPDNRFEANVGWTNSWFPETAEVIGTWHDRMLSAPKELPGDSAPGHESLFQYFCFHNVKVSGYVILRSHSCAGVFPQSSEAGFSEKLTPIPLFKMFLIGPIR
jgi:hypothetical protein